MQQTNPIFFQDISDLNHPILTLCADSRPFYLTFQTQGGKSLFSIKEDGSIEKGEAFTTQDEMSLQFWEILSEAYPIFKEKMPQGKA